MRCEGKGLEVQTFTNRVGALAEAEGHHPAILTEWGHVTVTLWTHKIRALHRAYLSSMGTDAALPFVNSTGLFYGGDEPSAHSPVPKREHQDGYLTLVITNQFGVVQEVNCDVSSQA